MLQCVQRCPSHAETTRMRSCWHLEGLLIGRGSLLQCLIALVSKSCHTSVQCQALAACCRQAQAPVSNFPALRPTAC